MVKEKDLKDINVRLDKIIKELEKRKKEKIIIRAKEGEHYFYLNDYGDILSTSDYNSPADNYRYNTGNYSDMWIDIFHKRNEKFKNK